MEAPFGSWGTQGFIVGVSADAFVVPWVFRGTMGSEAFSAYAEQVLVPELEWWHRRFPRQPGPTQASRRSFPDDRLA